MLEKFFKLSENHTDAKTEILAGITTFMTMAYILAVNPSIMAATGMDSGAVFTATALAAFIGTLLMAIFANYPFALAPGMGLNAYFAYTVVIGMGYTYAGNQGYGAGQTTEMPRKKSSAGKIILIICILLIGLPIVVPTALGLLLAAFGVLVVLAISAIAIWVAAVATAAVGILLGIHGFGQLFYSPALGIGMLGVGCLLLALGAVFTVLIGWGCIKLIPMMFRGFVNLCRIPFQKKRGECR